MIAATWWFLQAVGGVAGVIRFGPSVRREAVIELTALDAPAPEPATDTMLIDQRELMFVPRALAVTVGTTVLFRNSDPILHNVFSPFGPDRGFDLGTYPRTTSKSRRFTEPGEWVVLCHVHPEMVAYISVVASPWHAVADREGRFAVGGLPPGRYRLTATAPHVPPVHREIEVVAGRTTEVDLEPAADRRRGG